MQALLYLCVARLLWLTRSWRAQAAASLRRPARRLRAARSARAARAARVCGALFRRGRARSFGCACAHAHARGRSDVRLPALWDAQETPQPDSVLQASVKVVAQVLPLVTFLVAALMLLNLLVVQPLKESQAGAQAQTQAQLAQTQAQLNEVQAESRQQFELLQAALQEVPRLSGKVEVMQDNVRNLQLQRR